MTFNFLFCSPNYRLVVILLVLDMLVAGCQKRVKEIRENKTNSFISKQKPALRRITRQAKFAGVPGFRQAAQVSTPATVKVRSFFAGTAPDRTPDFYFEFFDKEYVGPHLIPASDGYLDRTGSASGVLISNDGYIVTNYHVINAAKSIEVTLADRRSYPATVIGCDKATDLALLKIKEDKLPFIEFGNSDSVAIGDIVLVVGNPLNFASTVTQGIISYKARNIAHPAQHWTLQSYLQTDAVVNVGNSGGALVDLHGKLVGIVAAIASPNGVYAGYSFAIPVEVVKKTADDLLNYGQVRRGSFGMTVIEMDAEKAAALKTDVVAGIYIDSTEPGGAAETAGLATGDIITSIAGSPIESLAELSELIARSSPHQKLALRLVRNGRYHRATIALQDDLVLKISDHDHF